MGSRPDWDDIERELREADKAAAESRRLKCVAVVRRWKDMVSARRSPGHSPTIGTAIEARFYFLDVLCPGCRQVKQIDLRTLDRHPQTRLENIVPKLSCQACRPRGPMARIVGIAEHKWETGNRPAYIPKRGL
jgi:hypothetical protein